VPATHPDPDTLTAYVEQSLPSGERDQVIEHLAACSFCREVVALSLPSVPEQAAVQTVAPPSRSWRFGLRWAGALAVVAIAVAIGVVVRGPANKELTQKPAPQVQAKIQPTTQTTIPPAVATEANASKTTQQTAADQSGTVLTAETSSAHNDLTRASRRSSGANASASSPSGVPPTAQSLPLLRERGARSEEQNAELKDAANLNSGGLSVGMLTSGNQPRPVQAQPGAFVNNNVLAEDRNYTSSYTLAREEQAREDTERLKKQTTLNSPRQIAEQDAPRKGFLRKAVPGPIATTVLDVVKTAVAGSSGASDPAAGERSSFAGGAPPPVRPPISPSVVSKQAATIPHEAAETPRAKVAASPDQLHWRIQDGKLVNSADLNQWHEAYPPQGDETQFKVVQAQGHEVWAGGTNATLVHSWNGGVDWQKLNLGSSASGDIEKISLSGGDVQVKTSNGQSLISRDGGKTWTPLNADGTSTQPK
jgi:hypothetical protein